jgi:hypothetical protein
MKTSLLAILLLSLPALSEDAGDRESPAQISHEQYMAGRDALYAQIDQSIKEYYEEWYAANLEKLESEIHTYTLAGKCRKGGHSGIDGDYSKGLAPERTDPMYLSWKQLLRQHYIAEAFERSWTSRDSWCMRPQSRWKQWPKHVKYREFCHWIKNNLEVKRYGSYIPSNLYDGPNPEEWTADRVSQTGKAVDESGEVTMESAYTSRSTHVRWFWIPLVIGFVMGAFFLSKGTSPSLGFAIGYCGYGLLAGAMGPLGAAGGLKMVLMELLAAWIVFGIVVLGIIKLALSGLGLKKDAA